MNGELKKAFEYFVSHHDELVSKYDGRFVLIKDEEVVGDFPSDLSALQFAKSEFDDGTYLIQKVLPGEESYTQHFYSRATFA